MYKVDLNSDLGESFGAYTIGLDEQVIQYVSSANVACGYHAGDPLVMDKTVAAAKAAGVAVGAHPGYPDLMGFGRRNMVCSPKEVKAYIQYQMGALKAFTAAHGVKLQHCKPHGALYNMAGKDIWRAGVDVLIPVPLHYTRLIKRRYNQSALLAKELSKITGVPVEYSALVKHKRTRPQVEFSGRRRKHNLRGAFKLKYAERSKGKKIVLIDDVLTTGSTLKECAKALQVGAPESIDLLTVARVCKD